MEASWDKLTDKARYTIEGWELERTCMVTGVTGDGHAKIYTAGAYVVSNEGVDIGTAHPTITYARVRELRGSLDDADTVRLVYIYARPTSSTWTSGSPGQPALDTIEVGATVNQVPTNKDKNGDLISVSYTFPSDYKLNTALQSQTLSQSPRINRPIPQNQTTFSRQEATAGDTINQRAKIYVGKVNSVPWSMDTQAAARTWLCTGIVGRSNDGGNVYTVTYSFQYKNDTWDAEVGFSDPNDGNVPADVVDGTGIKTVQMLETINFAQLNL